MEQRSARTRGVVFGALMAALVILCSLVPVPFGVFMPIPLVLAYVRFGGRVAGLTAAVALIFCAMFVGLTQAILLIPGGILPGLVFGYGFRNKLRPLYVGLTAVVASFFGFAVWYVVMRGMVLGGQDPIANMFASEPGQRLVNAVADILAQQLAASPPSTEAQRQAAEASIQEYRNNPAGVYMTLLPVILLFSGAFSSWLNFKLCRWVLPRLGHDIPTPTPFREFRLPAWMTWVFAIASFGSQYVQNTASLVQAPWGVKVLLNVLSALLYIFVLAGLAVAYGFLRKRDVPKPAAVGLSLLGFFVPQLGLSLYVLLAMWDTIFDFRGLGHGMLKQADDTP